MDKALSCISQAGYGQLVKMLLILEPNGIFRSNFAYLFIIALLRKRGAILDLGCPSFHTSFFHSIHHNLVSTQYLENTLIEFNQTLYMH